MFAFLLRSVTLIVCAVGCAASSQQVLAMPRYFTVNLSGLEEMPAVRTFGIAFAQMSYDPDTRFLAWSISFRGLSSEVSAVQLCGPAMVGDNGPVEIKIATRSRPVRSPVNGSAMLTPLEAQEFFSAELYLNIATNRYPMGELRGQLVPPKG
jgi:CHRD domain